MKNELNNWEKEFDKWYEDETEYTATTSQISKWWLNKLSIHTQEIRERVDKLIVNTPDEVARLNSEAGIGNPIAEYAYNQAVGYEKAINDVLQILESNE